MKKYEPTKWISFCLLSILFSCATTHQEKRPDLKVAIGYIEDQKSFSDEIRQIITKQLSPNYSLDFILIKSADVNFNEKQVVWDIGIGGTIFALKEMGEGIQFFPFMWEDRCTKSPLLISMNGQKENAISKSDRILVLHSDYPSPLALTLLYNAKTKTKIYETNDPQKATEALVSGKVDLVITEATTRLLSQKTQIILPILQENKNIHAQVMREIEIPCRTFFYSPKLSEQDRFEITNNLGSYPWKGMGYDLLPLKTVDLERFQKIQSLFDWKKDAQLRTKLHSL